MSAIFEKNMHPVDRGIRLVLGAGLFGLAVAGPQTPWGFIGIIPLATGLIGSCPLYSVTGIRTCPTAK